MPSAAGPANADLPVSDVSDLHARAIAWLVETPAVPLPGHGHTLDRWRHLARIGADDVCLAKVLEAHYDAMAIRCELGDPAPAAAGELWAVWAAEPPTARLSFTPDETAAGATGERIHAGEAGHGRLHGRKAWCSGAGFVTHALVTMHEGEARGLARIAIPSAGLSIPWTRWDAVGMARVASGPLEFDGVRAWRVGAPGAYLSRPGFWHGGAGVAACWHGAACAIAETLRVHPRVAANAHAAANLGRIDCNLSAAAALLRETAARIDAAPTVAHVEAVTRLRSLVERVASDTIDRVGRALGPGPLCEDHAHARRCADLTTFIRQSHAESDWEALGRAAHAGSVSWMP